jgi:7-carboxy-7-deazaguanine synthase
MKINEIFYSIQGEGRWAGLPNIFIRTTGCNLRCSYCDTQYVYTEGAEYSINEIIRKIKEYPCRHICITGGEPLLQNDIHDLIDTLIKTKYQICLETNGSINIETIADRSLLISLDIKCPSSNMHNHMHFDNLMHLRNDDQLKFVIKDQKDYKYAKKLVTKYKPHGTVFFQPVWGTNPTRLSQWILKDFLDVRLSLQVHKILWGDKRGV